MMPFTGIANGTATAEPAVQMWHVQARIGIHAAISAVQSFFGALVPTDKDLGVVRLKVAFGHGEDGLSARVAADPGVAAAENLRLKSIKPRAAIVVAIGVKDARSVARCCIHSHSRQVLLAAVSAPPASKGISKQRMHFGSKRGLRPGPGALQAAKAAAAAH